MKLKDKNEVSYKYALRDHKILVSINDSKLAEGKYFCPECDGEMIPKRGEHNAHHFAHKSAKCQYDKYLHTISELIIEEWYNKADEVNISIPYEGKCPNKDSCPFYRESNICIKKKHSGSLNLKKWYRKCEREIRLKVNGHTFVPDLLLRKGNGLEDCIFIEIYVTHPCEQEKKDSGINIIELKIDDEEAIKSLLCRDMLSEDYVIRFHNFNIKDPQTSLNDFNYCGLQKFIILPTGRVRTNYKCASEDLVNHTGIFELTVSIVDFNKTTKQSFNDVASAVASQFVKDFRHCALCKYRGRKEYNFRVCNYFKNDSERICGMHDARNCEGFSIDESVVNWRIRLFNEYKDKYPVVIWIKDCEYNRGGTK